MRLEWTRAIAILSVTVLASACSAPPQPEIDAATAAIEKARSNQAAKYAGTAMRQAEESKAELDNELKVQEQKWVKSYDLRASWRRTPPPPRSAPPLRPPRRARPRPRRKRRQRPRPLT